MMYKEDEEVVETNAQLTLNVISEHLLDPAWNLRHKNLNSKQKNTLLLNQLFKKYPSRIEKFPWMMKQIIKGMVDKW